jgi:hypothetical protein
MEGTDSFAEADAMATALANGHAPTMRGLFRSRRTEPEREPADPARLLKKTRRASERPESVREWLWPGRIPVGSISALLAPRGAAKSYLVAEIAARLSNGAAWPDQAAATRQEPAEALIMSAEDDLDDMITPRLRACGANLERIHLVDCRNDDGTPADLSFECIETVANALPELKLIVIDPFAEVLGARNDRRVEALKTLINQLARFARRRRIAIVLVNATDRVSTGRTWQYGVDVVPYLDAGARAVWTIEPDRSDASRFVWLNARANLAGAGGRSGLTFSIDAESGKVAWDPEPVEMLADDLRPGTSVRANKVTVAATWLIDLLAEGPRPAASVLGDAGVSGITRGALLEAKSRLGIVSLKTPSFNGGWLWSLPEPPDEDRRAIALLRDRLLKSAEADIANGAVVAPKYREMLDALRSRHLPNAPVRGDGAGHRELGSEGEPEPPLPQMGADQDQSDARPCHDSKNSNNSKVLDAVAQVAERLRTLKDAEEGNAENEVDRTTEVSKGSNRSNVIEPIQSALEPQHDGQRTNHEATHVNGRQIHDARADAYDPCGSSASCAPDQEPAAPATGPGSADDGPPNRPADADFVRLAARARPESGAREEPGTP